MTCFTSPFADASWHELSTQTGRTPARDVRPVPREGQQRLWSCGEPDASLPLAHHVAGLLVRRVVVERCPVVRHLLRAVCSCERRQLARDTLAGGYLLARIERERRPGLRTGAVAVARVGGVLLEHVQRLAVLASQELGHRGARANLHFVVPGLTGRAC